MNQIRYLKDFVDLNATLLKTTAKLERLHGTAQTDVMTGGLGADIFVLSDACVVDTITDFL